MKNDFIVDAVKGKNDGGSENDFDFVVDGSER